MAEADPASLPQRRVLRLGLAQPRARLACLRTRRARSRSPFRQLQSAPAAWRPCVVDAVARRSWPASAPMRPPTPADRATLLSTPSRPLSRSPVLAPPLAAEEHSAAEHRTTSVVAWVGGGPVGRRRRKRRRSPATALGCLAPSRVTPPFSQSTSDEAAGVVRPPKEPNETSSSRRCD